MRKVLRLPLQQLVSPYGDDLGPVEVYLSRFQSFQEFRAQLDPTFGLSRSFSRCFPWPEEADTHPECNVNISGDSKSIGDQG